MYHLLYVAFLLSFPQQRDALNDLSRHSIPQNLPCADQPTSIKDLTEAFDNGWIPSEAEMTGSWVAIGFFGNAPRFNCHGVKRGPKFEWVIRANQYSVEMDIIGTTINKED